VSHAVLRDKRAAVYLSVRATPPQQGVRKDARLMTGFAPTSGGAPAAPVLAVSVVAGLDPTIHGNTEPSSEAIDTMI
jgi:hypothetical protein